MGLLHTGAAGKRRTRLFISYAHDDISVDGAYKHYRAKQSAVRGVVGRFLELLEERRLRLNDTEPAPLHPDEIFFDTERLHAGCDWSDTIEQALRECDAVVCLVGPGFLRSEFCIRRELGLARQLDKPLCPVLLREVPSDWGERLIPSTREPLSRFQAVPQHNGQLKAVESWERPEDAFAQAVAPELTAFLLAHVFKQPSRPAVFAPATQPGITPATPDVQPPLPYLCGQNQWRAKLGKAGEAWEVVNKALLISLRLQPEDEHLPVLHRARRETLHHHRPVRCDDPWAVLLPAGDDVATDPAIWNAEMRRAFGLRRGSVEDMAAQLLERLGASSEAQVLVLLLPTGTSREAARIRQQLRSLVAWLESGPVGDPRWGRLIVCVVDTHGRPDIEWLPPEGDRVGHNVLLVEPPCLTHITSDDVCDWRNVYLPDSAVDSATCLEWFMALTSPASGQTVGLSWLTRWLMRFRRPRPAADPALAAPSLGRFAKAFQAHLQKAGVTGSAQAQRRLTSRYQESQR